MAQDQRQKARRRLSAQGLDLLQQGLGTIQDQQQLARAAHLTAPTDPLLGGMEMQPRLRRAKSSDQPITIKCGRDTVLLEPGTDVVALLHGLCVANACEDRFEGMLARVRSELEKDVLTRPSWQKAILKQLGRNNHGAARASARMGGASAAVRTQVDRNMKAARSAAAAAPRSGGGGGGGGGGMGRSFAASAPSAPAEFTQPMLLRCGREKVTLQPGMSAEAVRLMVTAAMEAKGAAEDVVPMLQSIKRQLDRKIASHPRWVKDLATAMGRF